MKTTRYIIALLLLTVSAIQIQAQDKFRFDREVGLTAGVMVPADKDFGGEVTFGLTYEKFYINGLGIRTGLQYTPYTVKLDHTFGVPVALAYRWGKRNDVWYEDGFRAARISRETGGSKGNALASFLLNLNRGTEFYAGVTPGYVASRKSGLHEWTDRQIKTERYTENGSPLLFSLDAGAVLNYPIGRVSLNLNPAFHYVLTNTYKIHTVTTDLIDGSTTAKDRYIRWLFSVCGGISFAF